MGAVFQVHHINFVAYLTAEGRVEAPRAREYDLLEFLLSLTAPSSLISSTMGTPEDWTKQIAQLAQNQGHGLSWNEDNILSAAEVARHLLPLRPNFSGYDFYALVLPAGAWGRDGASFKFFCEAAVSSHSSGLILLPREVPSNLVEFLNPFPPLRALAETPLRPPAVVFWTRLQTACVLPLDIAREFYRRELLPALDEGLLAVNDSIRRVRQKSAARRILHLSDLHFGRREAMRRRSWLKEQLAQMDGTFDRVVVTGDLFDNPEEPLRESFDEFRLDVENLTGKDLLVVPGNHDVRRKGNAWLGFGRNAESLQIYAGSQW